MNLGRIIGLIVRVSALPLVFDVGVCAGMFLTRGFVAKGLAGLFVVTSTGAVFLWAIKNVKMSVIGYTRGESISPITSKGWTHVPSFVTSAADELAFAARSHILSTLLIGYVLIAFVFALAYQAVEGTQANSVSGNFYFSLTTFATVGYGDITPRGFGRVLACFEMVSGVAYNVLAIGGGAAYLLELGREASKD
jgi:hypothetical protein